MNIQKIKTQIENIIADNIEYIDSSSISEYIMHPGDPAWYHEFLDDSEGECTSKNIETLTEIVKEYDVDEYEI